MKTFVGIRCDGCLRIEVKNFCAADKRPEIGGRDRFFDFVVPPEVNPMTGKPKIGGFRGIASESESKKLAALHACPGCAPKIKEAFAKKAPELLPEGPLRTLMMQVKQKYGLRSLGMH